MKVKETQKVLCCFCTHTRCKKRTLTDFDLKSDDNGTHLVINLFPYVECKRFKDKILNK